MKKRVFRKICIMLCMALLICVPTSAATKPEKVQLNTITLGKNNEISINWKKVSGSTHYLIYYKEPGEKWIRIAKIKADNSSYIHKTSTKYPIKAGQEYYYTVKAYNEKTGLSGSYNTTGLHIKTASKPGKVILNKTSSSAYNKISISWKKTSGVTHYLVYYKKPGGSWKRIAKVGADNSSYIHTSSTTYPIEVGQNYYYTVKAYDEKTGLSGSYNTEGLLGKTALTKVILNDLDCGGDSMDDKYYMTVSWKPVKGCDYYKIYRKVGNASKWTSMETVKKSQTYWIDSNPVMNTTNTYTVRAYYSKTKTYGGYDSKGIGMRMPNTAPYTGTVLYHGSLYGYDNGKGSISKLDLGDTTVKIYGSLRRETSLNSGKWSVIQGPFEFKVNKDTVYEGHSGTDKYVFTKEHFISSFTKHFSGLGLYLRVKDGVVLDMVVGS